MEAVVQRCSVKKVFLKKKNTTFNKVAATTRKKLAYNFFAANFYANIPFLYSLKTSENL